MPAEFDRDNFAKQTNTDFLLEPDTKNATVIKLTEVSEERTTEHHRQFALVFQGPPEMSQEAKTYRISHPELGEFDLFLSPFGFSETGLSLEASFSTLI